MRKNFGAKPYLYPMPVLIIAAYDENGVPNAMNAAWGSICDMDQIAMYMSSGHKTVKNILKQRAFTVSMADAENAVAADYVGVVSGNKVPDKMKKTGWHMVKSELINAPVIEELPLTFECELVSFDEETECVVGKILNVSADERILNEEGNIDLSKFHPIIYDPANHDYVKLGEKVGNAFEDGHKL